VSNSGRPYDQPIFGNYLRTIRLEAGISQRKLAGLLNISPTFLCEVENGYGRTLDEVRCQEVKKHIPNADIELMLQLRERSLRALVFPTDDVSPIARRLLVSIYESIFDGSLSDEGAEELLFELQARREA